MGRPNHFKPQRTQIPMPTNSRPSNGAPDIVTFRFNGDMVYIPPPTSQTVSSIKLDALPSFLNVFRML